MVRILLIGKNGQVGSELGHTLLTLGDVEAVGRERIDLTRPDSIRQVMREIEPALVVNAAAYTAVDKAESEPDVAMAVNATAPRIIAEEAKRLGSAMVHYSTDYVFDGKKQGAYSEDDPANPLNTYGMSKWAGERAIQEAGIPYLILRTSWVYGVRGANFLLKILHTAAERNVLQVVDDQFGAPTWSRTIAHTTARLLALCFAPGAKRSMADFSGIYHLSARGCTSWCGFAQKIIELGSQVFGLRAEVHPIPAAEYRAAVARPQNSLLSNEKMANAFGVVQPAWESCLEKCMEELVQLEKKI